MKRFIIDVEEKEIRRYIVVADNYEEALEKIEDGEYLDSWNSGSLDERDMDTAELVSEETI